MGPNTDTRCQLQGVKDVQLQGVKTWIRQISKDNFLLISNDECSLTVKYLGKTEEFQIYKIAEKKNLRKMGVY